MNRAHDGVFFLSSFKNEKETSKFNYVAMGALEGALVNVIEAAEQILGPFFVLCNGGVDRRGAPEKNLGPFLKMAGRRPARHVAGRRPSIVDCDRRQAGGLHDKWQGRRHIMTDGRPGACMTDDRPKACHDTRQAEGLHMTYDSHPSDLCQCLVRGALGGPLSPPPSPRRPLIAAVSPHASALPKLSSSPSTYTLHYPIHVVVKHLFK